MSLRENLGALKQIIKEVGATDVRIIEGATHATLSVVYEGNRFIIPLSNGAILVARFAEEVES